MSPEPTAQAARDAELRRLAAVHRRLSTREEAELFALRPNEAAVERLVEHNLDLVVAQAELHRQSGLPFADLYQEGAVGLVTAVLSYDGQGAFREFASLNIGLQMDAMVEGEAGARA